MASDEQTSYLVSRLFYLRHIYDVLPDNLKDAWGVHRVLEKIESGRCWVFGTFFKDTGKFAGCCYGEMINGYFEVHLLFCRKVDVLKAVSLCFEELKRYCREQNITLYGVQGFIPEPFRAAKRFASRFGCADKGIREDISFVQYNKHIPCREFIIGV